MIATHLVLKYCAMPISAQALTDAARADAPPTVASELLTALTALASTETQLTELVATIGHGLRDVEQVLAAGPDDRIPLIDPAGVLQARGPRLDALLARRAAQIDHLRAITRLWTARHPNHPPS
ncbi:hypothetical protein ACIBXA_32355 [Micromonospora echinaurantiaca]|uniref:hypothetical protein n=1 Tax=Micromonospora echinaurantiaca TaxID=47857 RepID=UPI0037B10A6E